MTNNRTVFVVGGDYRIESMYESFGWSLVGNKDDADVIQFTGGADVTPSLYGAEKHERTGNVPNRDFREREVFLNTEGKLRVGICRGSQFLHVMNGGTMWQHVDQHAVRGTHPCFLETASGTVKLDVTSTHHQMLKRDSCQENVLLGWADNLATFKEWGGGKDKWVCHDDRIDFESLYYPNTRSFCCQGHPEYLNTDHEFPRWFFDTLNELL